MSEIALVDAGTLLGQAFQELASDRLPAAELRLLTSDEESTGTLTAAGDEIAIVQALTAEALETADLIVIAGTEAGETITAQMTPAATPVLVLESGHGSSCGVPIVAGVNNHAAAGAGVVSSPHAAVVALTRLLAPIIASQPSRVSATVVLPTSAHNNAAALDELFEQTRAILNFQSNPPNDILGHQLAFNMLRAAGASLLEAQVGEILEHPLEVAMQLLRGPVFHGIAISALIELARPAEADELTEALLTSRFIELAEAPAHLGPIDTAGRAEMLMGEIVPVAGRDDAFWVWAVTDNLTVGGAGNAIEIAEHLLASPA